VNHLPLIIANHLPLIIALYLGALALLLLLLTVSLIAADGRQSERTRRSGYQGRRRAPTRQTQSPEYPTTRREATADV
jgi:hypothetical protein